MRGGSAADGRGSKRHFTAINSPHSGFLSSSSPSFKTTRPRHLNFCPNSGPPRVFVAGCYAEGRGACLQFCAVNPTERRSGAAMDVRAGNASAPEVSVGCALDRGNLSVDFGDNNASCANGTVLPKPVARGGRGKQTSGTSSSQHQDSCL